MKTSRAKITKGALVHIAHTDGTTMEPRQHRDGVAMEPKPVPSPRLAQHVALAVARRPDYIASMDTASRPDDRADTISPETEAERQARLAWEAAGIAEADADIAAGRLVDADEVDAWIDSIGTDHELPVPYARG
jgi:predicted transcriptional regulator